MMRVTPLLLEAVQPVPQDVAGLWIEAGRRLVEDQHVGLVDQAASDREPSFHPARECVDLRLALLGELDEIEEFFDAVSDDRSRQVEVAAVHHQVVVDRQLLVEVVLLWDNTEPVAQLRSLVFGVEAQNRERPARDRAHRPDHPHRRGLACAVRSEESERLTLLDGEVDAIDGNEVPKLLCEIVSMDQSRHEWKRVLIGGGLGARIEKMRPA